MKTITIAAAALATFALAGTASAGGLTCRQNAWGDIHCQDSVMGVNVVPSPYASGGAAAADALGILFEMAQQRAYEQQVQDLQTFPPAPLSVDPRLLASRTP